MGEPLATFKGFAKKGVVEVDVYSDRVEWAFKSHMRASARLFRLAGADKVEMMPIRAISSVTSERDGMAFEKVTLIASGNTVGFKLKTKDAIEAKDLIQKLMLAL